MRGRHTFFSLMILFAVGWLAVAQLPPPSDEKIDFNKARELLKKMRSGEALTPAEQRYLDRAKEARRKSRKGAQAAPKASLELTPLTDMTESEKYKGRSGGLYGEGRNTPPQEHLQPALKLAQSIQPRDEDGKPSKTGKIVLLSVGMSNTTQEFSQFVRLANQDPAKSASVVIVDGAQGGQDVADWAQPEKRFRRSRRNPWEGVEQRLRQASVSAGQVQVVWLKQARRSPATNGEFPKHTKEFNDHMVTVLHKLKERFPNLYIAYLSSRIYAGNARSALNPEPYAYEYGFAIRELIQRQIDGDPELNYDLAQGEVKSPLLLWGPYLWANGTKGRQGDDLKWLPEDFAVDGTHPSPSGRQKVARLLLNFMKTDPTAKIWFTKK